ncbi:MAG: endonuclease/exonuclease/phosphatase family protein [bacterium]
MEVSCILLLLVVAAITWPRPSCAFDPTNGDFTKSDPDHVRVMAYNTHGDFIITSSTDDEYQRILQAIDPDIIVMEEIGVSLTSATIQTRLDSVLPLGGGQKWGVHMGLSDGFNRNIVASRWTETMQITDTTPASEVRGVTATLIDLPNATYATDIYVMGIHLKAFAGGTNTTRRQKACDALAKWFGDIRTSGGSINLAANTPAFVTGDFNFVDTDPQQPEMTLRTGDIQDNATYGADIKGDWDVSDLTDLQPADPNTADTDTWASGSTNPTSRLDRFYYTDSAVTVVHSFVLNTLTMSSGALTAAGLVFTDSQNASDHLPVVADYAVQTFPVELSLFKLH